MHILDQMMKQFSELDPTGKLNYSVWKFDDKVSIETTFEGVSGYSQLMTKDVAAMALVTVLFNFKENFEIIFKDAMEQELSFTSAFTMALNNTADKIGDNITEGDLKEKLAGIAVSIMKGEQQ